MAAPAAVRKRRWIVAGASVAATAVLGTLIAVSTGYDAQEAPRLETGVWVTRDAGQYARVNTELGEIDTVRSVDDPSGVVQAGAEGVVLSEGMRRQWAVDAASPVDLVESSAADEEEDESSTAGGESTPAGTDQVVSSGSWVGYLTENGEAYAGALGADGTVPSPVRIDPFAAPVDDDGEPVDAEDPYLATALAIDDEGLAAVYSADEGAVRSYDAATGEFVGEPTAVEGAPEADAPVQLAVLGGRWALSAPATGELWIEGREVVETGLAESAQLQQSSSAAQRVLLADAERLLAVGLSTGQPTEVVAAEGTPAAPVLVAGREHAAWVTASGGSLWSTGDDEVRALDGLPDETEDRQLAPRLRSNGDRVVLNETATGLLWTVPDGRLIPIDQWSLADETQEDQGTVQVDDVAEQEPPVAEPDVFGVRAGAIVSLPMLLNDHDPNARDVLTIAPESLAAGLSDGGFGSLGLTDNDQVGVVQVAASEGSAGFSYQVTDGSALSEPAQVTLNVVPDDQNTAPEWCAVEGCTQRWPTPQLAPGGTLRVPVLDGWIDAEGDPFVVSEVVKADAADPITAVVTADGALVLRHQDPNAGGGVVRLEIVVTDSRGASTTRELEVTVTGSPALEAPGIALSMTVGGREQVPAAELVTGGSGSLRLSDAVVASAAVEGGLGVTANTASGAVELNASAAGQYLVNYTVQDTVSLEDQSGVVRVTVVDQAAAPTLRPLTAFVRPNEDTTIDVISSVQNASDRVLMVADVTTADPNLSVDAVGQARIRLSGTTDDGLPGTIGTARVSITDGAGTTVQGSVTVFLVSPSSGVGPIAVPDTATVRVGQQIDIPVTANDVSPFGERLMVHPELSGGLEGQGELRFVSSSLVRYLAPEEPGVYTLRYSVHLENEPQRLDAATITVTVLEQGVNRAPQPPVLEGRVLSGKSTTIAALRNIVDPDGDAVVLAGVSQPPAGSGVASISADGASIVYSAPASGVTGGQVRFEYTVRDAQGEEAVGAVRVGVIDAALVDTAPVTYSDYVRVQVGSGEPVTVRPLLNDRDPELGALELVSVVPNAPRTGSNPEFARLEGLVDQAGTSLEDGVVSLLAGDRLGTHSYVYTVRSSESGSTSEGYLVVSVSSEAASDSPTVTDTVLTARNRHELATGIDVVAGKVQWASGSAASLELELWGSNASRYTVSGQRISGALREGGDLVPFSLTGADAAGEEIVAYGFLRIPAFDDMRVQLRTGVAAVSVNEEQSAEVDIREFLDVDDRDDLEVRNSESLSVQRSQASCTVNGAEGIRYDAGREAPWSDTCAVPVRLEGQSSWTIVPVPIVIVPKDPQAVLQAISLTVPPGESASVDLYEGMTSWEGGREGDPGQLDYRVSAPGGAFEIVQQGTTLTIDARADATPGTRQDATVSVSGFGGLSAAVRLTVGAAAPDAPDGATLRQSCTVSQGPSCSISVTGVPGEYDPFAGNSGSGLRLAQVGNGSVRCAVATVTGTSPSQVTATWPAGERPAGGECVVPFTVQDAQNRTGNGQLTIDVQGYPQRPSSVRTIDYNPTGVTLAVVLGEAALAHPSLTGVAIYENGNRVGNQSCSPAGGEYHCTVGGLVNGENHQYTARAVNSVGESLDSSAVSTNAYAAPSIESVSARQVDGTMPSEGSGTIEVTVRSAADVGRITVTVAGQSRVEGRRGGESTYRYDGVPVGDRVEVSALPESTFSPPRTEGGDRTGAAQRTTVRVAGAPRTGPIALVGAGADSITVSEAPLDANFSDRSTSRVYAAWTGGRGPDCFLQNGVAAVRNVDASSSSTTIGGLQTNTDYNIGVCVANGWASAAWTGLQAGTWTDPGAPTGSRTTYEIGQRSGFGNSYTWGLSSQPNLSAPRGFEIVYTVNGGEYRSFSDTMGQPGEITAKYCSTGRRVNQCSAAATPITVAVAGAPQRPVTVTFSNSCADAAGGAPHGVTVTELGASPQISTTSTENEPSIINLWTRTWTVQAWFTGAYADLAPENRKLSWTTPGCGPAEPPEDEDGDDGGNGTSPSPSPPANP